MEEQLFKFDKKYIWRFGVGALIWGIVFFISLMQNGDFYVDITDQLDGEIIYYLLKSQHVTWNFFDSFMQGRAYVDAQSKISLLFCMLFSPMTAYLYNLFRLRLVAYCGMYLLLRNLKCNDYICFWVSLFFSMIPFVSVFGATVMGIPCVIWAFWNLAKKEQLMVSYMVIALFALDSSLILSGYFLIGAAFCVFVLHPNKHRHVGIALVEMVVIYLFTNVNLLLVMFGKGNFVSHRSEWILVPENAKEVFCQMMKFGHFHAQSFHKYILYMVVVFCVLSLCFWKKMWAFDRRRLILVFWLICLVFSINLFRAFFVSEYGIEVRKMIFGSSSLLSFQFDRLYFVNPTIWYVLFGVMLTMIYNWLSQKSISIARVGSLLVVLACCSQIALNSYLFKDFMHICGIKIDQYIPLDSFISWNQFYNKSLYDDVKVYIGGDWENVDVVSVGLHPSVALYNGFSCIDGYSTNYDAEYKHKFYEIIRCELEKNDTLKKYFCDWGSRCYILSDELGVNFCVKKGDVDAVNLSLNTEALKKMGGDYVLSTVLIKNAADIDLTYEKNFLNEQSFYTIYLYKVN